MAGAAPGIASASVVCGPDGRLVYKNFEIFLKFCVVAIGAAAAIVAVGEWGMGNTPYRP